MKNSIRLLMLILMFVAHALRIQAQSVLFDFDNIPVHTPFPVNQVAGGVTAHFTGTGQGYSIQDANTMGFTPAGFSGHVIYPNSIYLADLLINLDQKITDFSIMYSCQELGCDDAATMRVTAFLKGSQVTTNTKIATFPGTWPVDTLRCSFATGFDSLVVHYDKRPPTCRDYGVIFLADNMRVTPLKTSLSETATAIGKVFISNPSTGSALISLWLSGPQRIHVTAYDITGKAIGIIYDGSLPKGENTLNWNAGNGTFNQGIYIIRIATESTSCAVKVVLR